MIPVNTSFKKLHSLICTFPLLLSGLVHATEATDYKTEDSAGLQVNEYFYIGGKLGINRYHNGCQSWSIDCDKSDTAGGINAGYQFNSNFAIEAAYLALGEAVAVYPMGGLEQTYTGSMKGFELSALAILPVSDDFSVFAKGGLFNWYGTSEGPNSYHKESGVSPAAGVGISYQISTAWQARVEYQYFYEVGNEEIGGSNSNLATLGLIYQFSNEQPQAVIEEIYIPLLLNLNRLLFL